MSGSLYFAGSEDHYRIYGDEFVRDLRREEYRTFVQKIARPEDYRGEAVICFAPSQHDDMTKGDQRALTESWAVFLNDNTLPLSEVHAVTSLSQSVFDGLCRQSSIESLRIKWLNCKDISAIKGLKKLKKLFIENGSRIEDLTPLAGLTSLEVLILGETVKITDYSCLSVLSDLRVFSVCSYQSSLSSRIRMDSADFLHRMPNLEYVDLVDVRN